MATVIYVKQDTKSVVGMSRAINYVQQDYKTTITLEDGTNTKLVSGQNVNPETAFDEFRATKRIYGKSSKVQFYHVVQSFSPKEEVPPETVHEAGVRLAKYFDGFEVVIATHIAIEKATNFNRPAFVEMAEAIKHKKVATLIVKDSSRLGRNYIETGQFVELVLPQYDVRFIAVNDNTDSEYRLDDMF